MKWQKAAASAYRYRMAAKKRQSENLGGERKPSWRRNSVSNSGERKQIMALNNRREIMRRNVAAGEISAYNGEIAASMKINKINEKQHGWRENGNGVRNGGSGMAK